MRKKKLTAGESLITSAKQALAFARGEKDHGCVVHIPEEIDVKAIRQKVEEMKIEELRALWQEGPDSGPSVKAEKVFARLKAKYAAMQK